MPQRLFWGPVGGGLESCHSTLKIGLGLLGGEISDQNINSIPVQSFVRDRQYSSGIGQYLGCTDTQVEGQNGKLYRTLCAVWLSSEGATLKDHVLG